MNLQLCVLRLHIMFSVMIYRFYLYMSCLLHPHLFFIKQIRNDVHMDHVVPPITRVDIDPVNLGTCSGCNFCSYHFYYLVIVYS